MVSSRHFKYPSNDTCGKDANEIGIAQLQVERFPIGHECRIPAYGSSVPVLLTKLKAKQVHQQVQLSLISKEGAQSNNLLGWHHKTQSGDFAIDNRFKPYGLVTGLEAKKGEKAKEIDLKPGEEWTQAYYIKMNERYQRQTLEQLQSLATKDKPFFLQYWPLWPLNFVHDGDQNLFS